MHDAQHGSSKVRARVTEFLPTFGLAYLTDEDWKTWTVTKSTEGPGLQALQLGKHVELTVAHHDRFSLVNAYATLI